MNDRYEELSSLYLDRSIDADGAEELSQLVRGSRDLMRDFKKRLLVAEMLVQDMDPTRSGQAFMDGLATRMRAESDGPGFVDGIVEKVQPRRRSRVLRFLPALAAAAAAVVIGVGLFVMHSRGPVGPRVAVSATANAEFTKTPGTV